MLFGPDTLFGLSPRDHRLPAYFGAIDLLRFIAAMAIVILHYPLFFGQGTAAAVNELSPIDPDLLPTELAVPLFWTISGFVFLFNYRKRPVTIRRFVWRRFARLYPLHFATLLIVAALQALSLRTFGETLFLGNFDLYHFFLNLTFTSGWGFEAGPSFNGPVWSVSIEVLIYAVFILVLPLLRLSTLTSVGLAVLFFIVYSTVSPNMALLCGTYFFIGCVCFEAVRYLRASGLVILGTTALLGALLENGFHLTGILTLNRAELFIGVLCFAAAVDIRFPWLTAAATSRWNLGNYSYAIYLIHIPLMLVMANVLWMVAGTDLGIYRHPAIFAVFLGLLLTLAVLVYRHFELPAKHWLCALRWSQIRAMFTARREHR